MRSETDRSGMLRKGTALILTLASVGVLAACGSSSSSSGDGGGSSTAPAPGTGKMLPGTTTPLTSKEALDQTVAFLDSDAKATKPYKIAYLAECYANNPYCEAKFKGVKAAADKFGASVTLFDANFSAANQIKQVQDAVNQNFDGYVFGPAVQVPGCAMWKKYLQPTGKPVATEDIPLCNNPDWTPGTVGFTAFQTQSNLTAEAKHNLDEACAGQPCKALSVSGFLGSDLYNMWSKGTDAAVAATPNVTLVQKTIPADFSAPTAYSKVLDQLRKDPDVSVILSHDDNMSVGIVRAIRAAGKVPGKDIKVYSQGGPKTGIDMIKDGIAAGTTALLPFEEGEYATAQVMRYLIDGKATPGFVNLKDSPKILNGPGSVYITKANASKVQPEY